jgi:hypothetical protein
MRRKPNHQNVKHKRRCDTGDSTLTHSTDSGGQCGANSFLEDKRPDPTQSPEVSIGADKRLGTPFCTTNLRKQQIKESHAIIDKKIWLFRDMFVYHSGL